MDVNACMSLVWRICVHANFSHCLHVGVPQKQNENYIKNEGVAGFHACWCYSFFRLAMPRNNI